MTARLMILNGPNLNLLGVREPHIYGSTTLAAIRASCEEFATFAGAHLSFHQSNHEGVLVDLIQAPREEADTIIINPAAYSFTSIAMFDAFKAFEGPIIEVQLARLFVVVVLRNSPQRRPLHRASLSGPSPTKIIALAATFLASRNAATIDGLGGCLAAFHNPAAPVASRPMRSFERATGHKVIVSFEAGLSLMQKVNVGVPPP
jgi:3-dehydroquinate dehydratase II